MQNTGLTIHKEMQKPTFHSTKNEAPEIAGKSRNLSSPVSIPVTAPRPL